MSLFLRRLSALKRQRDRPTTAPVVREIIADAGGGGGGGPVAWADVTGKPSTFPPSGHTHPASDVTDFNSASRGQTEAALVAGANVTITPGGSGATRTLTIAASGSGGGGSSPAIKWVI